MKKAVALLTAILMLWTMTATVTADVAGAVAGDYYYTDIVTYLWNTPVNAINIGGVTLIDAESMRSYGFAVNWYASTRALEIIDNKTQKIAPAAANGSLLDMKSGRAGTVAGKYYYTDIKTTLNGKIIVAFNIGGRTFIGAEAMREFGYDVIWDATKRTLRIQNKNTPIPTVTPKPTATPTPTPKPTVTPTPTPKPTATVAPTPTPTATPTATPTPTPTAVTFNITSLQYTSDALYKVIGGGTAEDDYALTLKIPSTWGYSKDMPLTTMDSTKEQYIVNITLSNFSSKYSFPSAMQAYNTKDNTYSEELAKGVLASERFALSGREVLAEHVPYGVAAITHVYYMRVDPDYVVTITILSPPMSSSSPSDGEAQRRQVLDSAVFVHKPKN